MRSRVAPIWAYTTAFNLTCTFIMIKPLRPEEIKHQMNKRIYMGKKREEMSTVLQSMRKHAK